MKRSAAQLALVVLGIALGFTVTRIDLLGFTGIDWEKTAKAINEIAQTIALLVVGWWTYSNFISQRSNKEKAVVEHEVKFVQLEPLKILIRGTISVRNAGRVLITPRILKVVVNQILPRRIDSKTTFPSDVPEENWPVIQTIELDCTEEKVTLEPEETQKFHIDFQADLPLICVQLSSALYSLPDGAMVEGLRDSEGKTAKVTAEQLDDRDDVIIWDQTTIHDVPISGGATKGGET